MKYLSSAEEFFNHDEDSQLASIREAVMAVPAEIWQNLGALTLTQYEPSTQQEAAAILDHQLDLLESFNSIEEINATENYLIKHGYNPVFLTLEGAYFDTLNNLRSINEGLLSTIKDFVMMMTEGGSAIGILQFVLDIIGLIPFSWAGIPIDTVANLLNAAISFYRGHYLMGCLNLVVAIPGTGQVIGGALKGIIKPFAKISEKLFAALWKGESAIIKTETMAFKTGALEIEAGAKASSGIIQTMGKALKGVGEFIITAGLKIIKGIAEFIGFAINKVSLGLIPKPTGLIKWIDELALKMTSFGKGSIEAGELLMKEDAKLVASGERAAVASTDAAKAAGIATADAEKIGAKFGDIPGFNTAMQAEIIVSDGYKALMKKGASESIQKMYIQGAMTEKLVGNILAKEGQITGKSLTELLKSPELIKELGKSGSKLGDKALADAIKAGDSAAVSKLMDEVITNPAVSKLISPNVAKTAAIFKESPELLIKSVQNLGKVQADLTKFTGKLAYRGISGRAFIVFVIKAFLKGSDCAKYLVNGSPDEALDRVKATASDTVNSVSVNIKEANQILNGIVFEEESTVPEVTAEDLEKFKAENPDGYSALMKQVDSGKEAKEQFINKTKSINPCIGEATVAEAATGCVIKMPTGIDPHKRQTDLRTDKEWEESGLNEYTKGILKQLGQDANIDPQHPLSEQSPRVKAYFSDVWDSDLNTYSPNESSESRIDAVLNDLEKAGKIKSGEKLEIKKETLDLWESNSLPNELQTTEIIKESLFKIGKLSTIR